MQKSEVAVIIVLSFVVVSMAAWVKWAYGWVPLAVFVFLEAQLLMVLATLGRIANALAVIIGKARQSEQE